ncbi:Transmembrane protein 106C [Merluccius polli]|uniref:Transmembrane protein 106C n=1 Tax=Merluccius polli TaxID=89951 RepID=A0AA47M1W5_MERPO|nr:Transmembrane protein 106C [Merluccius polli]
MGARWSRSGSTLALFPPGDAARRQAARRGDGGGHQRHHDDDEGDAGDDDSLDGLDRQEDIARFPYVEFTGRDSITCPTCQGSGRIPSEQVNELVALIPYSDQRLQPQRTKLYVVLSTLVCLLASTLVAFFLFPRSMVVVDDGIRLVTVHFDRTSTRVLLNMTSTLNFSNSNFFSVLVSSLSCQVLYMKTVVGTQQLDNVITIQPLSMTQVNYTVSVEIGDSAPYVYFFCTMPSIKVHKIVVYIQTSVKTSNMVRSSQNSLEAYRYIDCGNNLTNHQPPHRRWHHLPSHPLTTPHPPQPALPPSQGSWKEPRPPV